MEPEHATVPPVPGDGADPKPPRRVRDPELLRWLHLRWLECANCGEQHYRLSLHHISKHPRDDVEANLVMLCGDGTTGCHGLVEANKDLARRNLGMMIMARRPDTIAYLDQRYPSEGAKGYLQRVYKVPKWVTPNRDVLPRR